MTASAAHISAASPRPRAFPPTRIAVALAFFVNGLVLGSWTPQVPLLAARLGIGEATLGLFILALGLGAISAMPVIGGVLASSGSRRPVLITQALLAIALPLVVVVAPSAVFVAIAIFFFGATMGGMDVAMNANAVAVERRLGRAIMSSCHGFWSVGGFVGAGIGGTLIEAIGALPHALAIGAVTLALIWPVYRTMFDDRQVSAGAGEESGDGGWTAIKAAARRNRPALLKGLAIGILALFAMVPEGAAIDWSAIYLRQDLGAAIASSGFAFAAFSASMAVFRFAGDGIRDRLGAVRTVRLSLIVGIAGLWAVGLAPSLGWAIAGFALLGVGLSNIVPVAFSAAGNIAGLRPGVGLAMATSLGYSGILIAPSAIGFIAEHVGFTAVFLGMSGLLLVILAMSALLSGADDRSVDVMPTVSDPVSP
ncbi:MFS transporter [Aurantimonas sp. A2-1-M11]|uniref:MFS transporter n=1 Tax=Aurantimonas sp. A2-1-M11 TaxID=3113712 RepID=UPI002F9367D1